MKHGDFTELAKFYVDRPGYSLELLKMIRNHIMNEQGVEEVCAADVGAGTGKLTENLAGIGVKGYGVKQMMPCVRKALSCLQGKILLCGQKVPRR